MQINEWFESRIVIFLTVISDLKKTALQRVIIIVIIIITTK